MEGKQPCIGLMVGRCAPGQGLGGPYHGGGRLTRNTEAYICMIIYSSI